MINISLIFEADAIQLTMVVVVMMMIVITIACGA